MVKNLTTSRIHRKKTTVPYIRLSGKWLETAGITPGARITVQVNGAGVLIVKDTTPRYVVTKVIGGRNATTT